MKVLIIGGGGREHCLLSAYIKSPNVKKIFVVPGNALMGFQQKKKVITYPNIKSTDLTLIWKIILDQRIDIVDVAQDDPLAAGAVDFFSEKKVATFGPTKLAAQIEWDKSWSREFMKKYKLPIPHFAIFTTQKEAANYAKRIPEGTYFVKTAGLAAGKGAIKTSNRQDLLSAIKKMSAFGAAGETFLIEEALEGEEFSAYAISDGEHFKILKTAQDNKSVFNFDEGPNTGGMGAIAPALVTTAEDIQKQIKEIFAKTISGMANEGKPYRGILYLGGIDTSGGVKIIEFNARWGDPEAQVIIPGIKNDYLQIVLACLEGKLNKLTIREDDKTRVCIVATSKGYPDDISSVRGKRIFGLEKVLKLPSTTIFGAGIEKKGETFTAAGGRVLSIVGAGKNAFEARVRAYKSMAYLFIEGNNLHYRTDIGWRDIERKLIYD